jgi:hypothetical protein
MGNKAAMTKTAHHLDLAIADPLGIITLANPPLNFLSVELLGAIADAVEACDADLRVRVIVLRAQGKTFCAGADLVGGAAGESGADGLAAIRRLYDQALRLFRRRKPMVAAIGGAAVGAGLGLALSADFRVATPAARFSANFVALGFHPGFAISHTLPRVIGAQRAAWMMLSAERVKGAQALDWGWSIAWSRRTISTRRRRPWRGKWPPMAHWRWWRCAAPWCAGWPMPWPPRWTVNWPSRRSCARPPIMPKGSPLCSSGARRVSPGADRQVYIGIKYIK